MTKSIDIPYDVYESESHLQCIIPMGGVSKSSVAIKLRDYALHITARREKPTTGEDFVRIQQECYRGDVTCVIDLPTRIDFEGIESVLSRENILTILIPKKSRPDANIRVTIEK